MKGKTAKKENDNEIREELKKIKKAMGTRGEFTLMVKQELNEFLSHEYWLQDYKD